MQEGAPAEVLAELRSYLRALDGRASFGRAFRFSQRIFISLSHRDGRRGRTLRRVNTTFAGRLRCVARVRFRSVRSSRQRSRPRRHGCTAGRRRRSVHSTSPSKSATTTSISTRAPVLRNLYGRLAHAAEQVCDTGYRPQALFLVVELACLRDGRSGSSRRECRSPRSHGIPCRAERTAAVHAAPLGSSLRGTETYAERERASGATATPFGTLPRRLPLGSLRVFVAVAEHLNFTRAGEALGVTPGAASLQIRALEEYLSRPLFRRNGRVVELTTEGAALLPRVQQALGDHRAARSRHARRSQRRAAARDDARLVPAELAAAALAAAACRAPAHRPAGAHVRDHASISCETISMPRFGSARASGPGVTQREAARRVARARLHAGALRQARAR